MLKRIQITNFSDHPMVYELSWPAHCVTVTPEQGVIQPRSNTIVCISANSILRKKGVQLPWCGNVHISCDGEVKVGVDTGVLGILLLGPLMIRL